MRNFKLVGTALLAVLTLQSCEKDENLTIDEAKEKNSISSEIIKSIASLSMNTKGIKKVDFMLPDGSTKPMYNIENDINLTEQQILDLASVHTQNSKHYHTNNLVAHNTRIDIMGVNDGNTALSRKEQAALRDAVNNYNRLDLSISFNLTFGTNENNKDIVVYYNPNIAESGGESGMPRRGRPHKYIQIYGMDNYNRDVIEHLITHEIGHSVGLRHTDWETRRSCNRGSQFNEGAGRDGANPIPGTPDRYSSTSVMKACFDGSEDGEFNRNDRIALNYLY